MLSIFNEEIFNKLIFSATVLILVFFSSLIVKRLIDITFGKIRKRVKDRVLNAKTRTLKYVVRNIIDAFLLILAILMILSHWGVNIMPILTGAGILGLAISFGSQTLIKDFIAGFFIIVEGQFSLGDRIKIGAYEGTVHKMTLRLTVLKDDKDNLVYIPNSQISSVIKFKEE